MKHAPMDYECPFCRAAATLPKPAPESAVVLVNPQVMTEESVELAGRLRAALR